MQRNAEVQSLNNLYTRSLLVPCFLAVLSFLHACISLQSRPGFFPLMKTLSIPRKKKKTKTKNSCDRSINQPIALVSSYKESAYLSHMTTRVYICSHAYTNSYYFLFGTHIRTPIIKSTTLLREFLASHFIIVSDIICTAQPN